MHMHARLNRCCYHLHCVQSSAQWEYAEGLAQKLAVVVEAGSRVKQGAAPADQKEQQQSNQQGSSRLGDKRTAAAAAAARRDEEVTGHGSSKWQWRQQEHKAAASRADNAAAAVAAAASPAAASVDDLPLAPLYKELLTGIQQLPPGGSFTVFRSKGQPALQLVVTNRKTGVRVSMVRLQGMQQFRGTKEMGMRGRGSKWWPQITWGK